MTNSASPSPSPQQPNATGASVYDKLVPHSKQIGYLLIGVGALLSAIPIVNVILYRGYNPPLLVWGALLALLFLGAGIWHSFLRGDARVDEADQLRILTLVLGGAAGFLTALFGLALPLIQYRAELSGGLQAWRENRVHLSLSGLAFLGGLVLMFLGLMQARTYERTQPELRRLLYGYNAVLGGLLLLCILVLINILPYSPVYPLSLLGKPLDWTSNGQFTLQPSTLSMLASLNKPLKIYVLLTERDGLDEQTAALLSQARSVNGLITWESVSRDLSPDKWKELEKDYKIPGGGLLLVYGTPPDASSEHIKSSDMRKIKRRPDGSGQEIYKGEYALMSAITSLYEGKARPLIYFTQGNGELALSQGQDFGAPADRGQSMSLFIEELSKSNYELKPLPFDRNTLTKSKSIPDDAEIVVLAGPQQPLSQEAVDALRKYLQTPRGSTKKKGKLIVLLDVIVNEQKKEMVQLNLEPLLREYNVEVGNSRVLAIINQEAISFSIVAMTNPRSKSPIGAAFSTGRSFTPFLFKNPRPVTPATPAQGAPATVEVDILLASYFTPEQLTWVEKDLVTPPESILKKIKDGGPEPDVRQVALGVTVADAKESPELPMGHPAPSGEQTPRMVVIGDARWLANDTEPKFRKANVGLFSSCLAWLRERPDIGTPPDDKERPTFSLTLPDESSEDRLKWLPGLFMILMIVTLGGGVWIVRRR